LRFAFTFLSGTYQAIDGRIRSYLSQFNRSLGVLSIGLFVSSLGFSVSVPFSRNPALAWIIISSLAALSGMGYLVFTQTLPEALNRRGGKQ